MRFHLVKTIAEMFVVIPTLSSRAVVNTYAFKATQFAIFRSLSVASTLLFGAVAVLGAL